MEKARQEWEEEEVLEEDEEETLQKRPPRKRNEGSAANATRTVRNGTFNSNGVTTPSLKPVNGADESTLTQETDAEELKINKDGALTSADEGIIVSEEKRQHGLEKCVYFDKDEGTGFGAHASLPDHGSIHYLASENKPGNGKSDKLDCVDIQKSSSISHQYKNDPRHDDFYNSSLHPTEIFEEDIMCHKPLNNEAIENVDIDLIKDCSLEKTELDIETLMEKQNTHDFYCPNCNSCITRKVILCKRKRKIQISSEDVKRNKLESVVDSELDAISAYATRTQAHETIDVCLDSSTPPAENDSDRDRELDLFRCLSCFSFFIPTGNGFKLFGFGSKNEQENMQDQHRPARKRNWFSSIFASDKGKVSIEQDWPQLAKLEIDTDLNSMSNPNEMVSNHESKSPVTTLDGNNPENIGEQAGNPTIIPQQDGLKFLISSGVSAEDLQTDQKLNVAIQMKSADEKETVLLLQTPASVVGNSDLDGKVNISANLPQEKVQNVEAAILTKSPYEKENEKLKVNDNALLLENDGAFMLTAGALPCEVSQHNITGIKAEIHTMEPLKVDRDAIIPSVQDYLLLQDAKINIDKDLKDIPSGIRPGGDTVAIVEAGRVKSASSQRLETESSPLQETRIDVVGERATTAREQNGVEIIRSIVYGGLVESITSVGVVSSAAGADVATLNILALGLANVVGGLFVFGLNLLDLKNERSGVSSNQEAGQVDRYKELLGQRENFLLHAVVALLSFLIFGLVPPITYGFSFRESNERDLKLIAVAAASLLCIVVLAMGKVYTQRPPKYYVKIVVYYVIMELAVSGVSYVVGDLIGKLLQKLRLFQSSSVLNLSLPETRQLGKAWAYY